MTNSPNTPDERTKGRTEERTYVDVETGRRTSFDEEMRALQRLVGAGWEAKHTTHIGLLSRNDETLRGKAKLASPEA
jgi:hypothetical protein